VVRTAWLPLTGERIWAVSTGPAEAATPPQAGVPSVVVKFNDLDLDTDAGAQALYRRLVIAARQVCPSDAGVNLHLANLAYRCRSEALARAVRQLNKPALTAIIPPGERERLNL